MKTLKILSECHQKMVVNQLEELGYNCSLIDDYLIPSPGKFLGLRIILSVVFNFSIKSTKVLEDEIYTEDLFTGCVPRILHGLKCTKPGYICTDRELIESRLQVGDSKKVEGGEPIWAYYDTDLKKSLNLLTIDTSDGFLRWLNNLSYKTSKPGLSEKEISKEVDKVCKKIVTDETQPKIRHGQHTVGIRNVRIRAYNLECEVECLNEDLSKTRREIKLLKNKIENYQSNKCQ